MVPRWVIGVASGIGRDGIDAALMEVSGYGDAIRPARTQCLYAPFSKELRELLTKVCASGGAELQQVALAHRVVGEAAAAAVRQIADRAHLSLQNVLCVGLLGRDLVLDTEGKFPSTLAVGTPAVVAERTGVTVVSDFRWRDLACGGLGNPLSVLPDRILFEDAVADRLVLHLGGMVHATALRANQERADDGGWELGPGTILLDSLIQQISNGKERSDPGGKYAVQGRQIPELFRRWTNHPYLHRRHPRVARRSLFAEDFAVRTLSLAQQQGWSAHDILCTATQFVARVIGQTLDGLFTKSEIPQVIILTGVGVRNGLLLKLLEEALHGHQFVNSDTVGVPAEGIDAVHAGLLACLTLDNVGANCPAATGATGVRLLGSLTPGTNLNWSWCLANMLDRADRYLEED